MTTRKRDTMVTSTGDTIIRKAITITAARGIGTTGISDITTTARVIIITIITIIENIITILIKFIHTTVL